DLGVHPASQNREAAIESLTIGIEQPMDESDEPSEKYQEDAFPTATERSATNEDPASFYRSPNYETLTARETAQPDYSRNEAEQPALTQIPQYEYLADLT